MGRKEDPDGDWVNYEDVGPTLLSAEAKGAAAERERIRRLALARIEVLEAGGEWLAAATLRDFSEHIVREE